MHSSISVSGTIGCTKCTTKFSVHIRPPLPRSLPGKFSRLTVCTDNLNPCIDGSCGVNYDSPLYSDSPGRMTFDLDNDLYDQDIELIKSNKTCGPITKIIQENTRNTCTMKYDFSLDIKRAINH